MSRYPKKEQVSPETRDEAMKIARATQTPGQTKEQTRLIAKGVEKGIALYKKQQKAKARESEKKFKKTEKTKAQAAQTVAPEIKAASRSNWLPWVLLALSWVGFVVYVAFLN
ncbi:MAG: DUF2956 domain-containing protein [Gammaproteobacteria bacterium]